VNIFSPIEYKGYLVFDYPEGENPVNNMVFTVDSTLADSLIIVMRARDERRLASLATGNARAGLSDGRARTC
jgi:hypothetical protein